MTPQISYKKQLSSKRPRRSPGQMAAVIAFLALAVFAVGLFSFEVGRANLANQQLQNAVDAAALAAVATLASEDNTDPTTAHNTATQTAFNLFKQNIVMGFPLVNTTIVGSPINSPAAQNATLYFEFRNPITHLVEPIDSANGKVVYIHADYGLLPAFAGFVGLSQVELHASSNGAVPQLDLVLCFDVSGSMDDQTPVTVVKRWWDNSLPSKRAVPPSYSNGQIRYDAPPAANANSGKIYDVLTPGPNGTSFNGVPPEYLSYAYSNDYIFFSVPWAAAWGVPDLRAGGTWPEHGVPPGNYSAGAPTWPGYPVFTDMVVNLDNQTTFGGITSLGYSFPDIPTLVEASRGNLDTPGDFNSSLAWSSVDPSVTPTLGYQQAYFQAASALLQPMNDAKTACSTFMDIINTDTDAHFGFVAFDSAVGTSPTDTETIYSIDQDNFIGMPNWGAAVPYPRPMVPLDPTAGNTGYNTAVSSLKACLPMGGTNMGAAIQAAVNELQTHQRTGAVRAIILFTDGQPTMGGPYDPDPWMNARAAAVVARDAGIPVYTVGLAQDAAIVAGETTILNDTNNNASTGGIAAISGHGATFNLVTNSPQLTTTFEKIARCLVELVSSG